MKQGFVVIRTDKTDKIAELVQMSKSLAQLDLQLVDTISVRLTAPVAWEIPMNIEIGGAVTEWGLYTPDSLQSHDPLSLFRARANNEYRLQLIEWLEDIAVGRAPALGIDMEGGYAALVVSGKNAVAIVTLSGWTYPGKKEFAVHIDRHTLVRDIYAALVAFWESDALNTAWSQWSSKPKWSLRSAVVEDYLAASDM